MPLLILLPRPSDQRTRAGFTLVELLVVIAIIGILVALLLPAVQAAREAARRSQCQNQLKQLGLACLNYESTNGTLPPGAVGHCDNNNARQCVGTGWSVEILPYLEEQATFDLFDFSPGRWYGSTVINASGVSNLEAGQTVLGAYLCPSDTSTVDSIVILQGNGDLELATSSYRGIAGAIDQAGQNGNPAQPPGQPIWWDRMNTGANTARREWRRYRGPLPATGEPIDSKPVSLAQVVDGTSKTALIGEHHTPPFRRGPVWASSWNYHNKGHMSRDESGRSAIYRSPDMEFCVTPSSTRTRPPTIGGDGDPFICFRAFGSTHAGGIIQFVYTDGSIHSIPEGIDTQVYLWLGTIADGEYTQDET